MANRDVDGGSTGISSDTKGKIRKLLDPTEGAEGEWWDPSRLTNLAIMGLILLSIVAIMLETVDSLAVAYQSIFRSFEVFCVVVFTVEYLLRLWSFSPAESNEYDRRLDYATSSYMVIDLLAILPFYFGGVFDLRFLRVVRLFRVFRVLKIARYSESLQTMGAVAQKKKPDLVIAITVTAILMILSSSALYFAEHSAQPDDFSSIPATLWWSVLTLSTVGYGDVVPVTPMGQFFAGITSLLGIGLFGLPASILAAGFIEEATKSAGEDAAETNAETGSEYDFGEWIVDEIDVELGGDVAQRAAEVAADEDQLRLVAVADTGGAKIQSGLVDRSYHLDSAGDRTSTVSLDRDDDHADQVVVRSEFVDHSLAEPVRLSITSGLSEDAARSLVDEIETTLAERDIS